MNEHEDNSSIAPTGLGKEGEGIGVIQELIPKGPVNSGSRWKSQSENIEGGYQVDVLEFLWLPHRMHNFTENLQFTL